MRSNLIPAVLAVLVSGSLPMLAAPAFAEDAATPAAHYSVETTQVGKLLDDPAAAAILKKLIPNVYANEMFQSMGREQTLKGIQQYEPNDLSDENLAKIQAEFDKIPAKG